MWPLRSFLLLDSPHLLVEIVLLGPVLFSAMSAFRSSLKYSPLLFVKYSSSSFSSGLDFALQLVNCKLGFSYQDLSV